MIATPQKLRWFMIAPVAGFLELGESLLPAPVALTTMVAGFAVMGVYLLLERCDRHMTPRRRRAYRVVLVFEALALPPILAHQGAEWFSLFLYPALFFALTALERVDARMGPPRYASMRKRRRTSLVADAPIDVLKLIDERE